MVHMPSLEIWEWGLKIFRGAPTLTTHVDHLLFTAKHFSRKELSLSYQESGVCTEVGNRY